MTNFVSHYLTFHMQTKFKSMLELFDYYQSHHRCMALLEERRWNGKPVCPHCGSKKTHYVIEGGKRYKCADSACYKKFNVLTGTVFENTKIDLRYWLGAIWLVTTNKKGCSSYFIHRQLGVTQKTAWFMLHRIREMLKAEGALLGSNSEGEPNEGAIIEADETWIGGKEKNKHGYYGNKDKTGDTSSVYKAKPETKKTAVVGAVERGGRIVVKKVGDVGKKTLVKFLIDNIQVSSLIVTDEHSGYWNVANNGFKHETVNHTAGEFVRKGNKQIHTNTIEGFWGLFKRGIYGVYHNVSNKHLDRYCNEFSYRYNSRKVNDFDRFALSLTHTKARLKYKDLIAK